jgi:hypothetical protein
MTKLFAAMTLATVIASPAFAQSFDLSVGSGNIASQIVEDDAFSAHARSAPQEYNDRSGHATGAPGSRPRKGKYLVISPIMPWASPSLLTGARPRTEAHNDNTSSIFAWNDGRLDAIAGPFGLVLAPARDFRT